MSRRSRVMLGFAVAELAVAVSCSTTPSHVDSRSRTAAAAWQRPAVRLDRSEPQRRFAAPLGRPLRVVLYGDSIADEAAAPFTFRMSLHGNATAVAHTFPGSSLCAWFPQMRSDLVRMLPDVVVIEFLGENFSPCAHRPAGNSASSAAGEQERFREDVTTAVEFFRGAAARVYLVPPPASAFDAYSPGWLATRKIYADVAARFLGVSVLTDAPEAVEQPGGRFTAWLPCRPHESCSRGVARVRSPDGLHMCPVEHKTPSCPVPSPGAWRYGIAMAERVLRDHGLT